MAGIKFKKSLVAWTIVSVTLLLIGCSHQKPVLLQLKSFNSVDSIQDESKITINKFQYFIIRNFYKSMDMKPYVDSLIRSDPDYYKYSNYLITFYKESGKTTVENLEKNPRLLDRYSNGNDLVYQYTWIRGKLTTKLRYKNGKIDERMDDIEVRDVSN